MPVLRIALHPVLLFGILLNVPVAARALQPVVYHVLSVLGLQPVRALQFELFGPCSLAVVGHLLTVHLPLR